MIKYIHCDDPVLWTSHLTLMWKHTSALHWTTLEQCDNVCWCCCYYCTILSCNAIATQVNAEEIHSDYRHSSMLYAIRKLLKTARLVAEKFAQCNSTFSFDLISNWSSLLIWFEFSGYRNGLWSELQYSLN